MHPERIVTLVGSVAKVNAGEIGRNVTDDLQFRHIDFPADRLMHAFQVGISSGANRIVVFGNDFQGAVLQVMLFTW
jgi:hypothetical protein